MFVVIDGSMFSRLGSVDSGGFEAVLEEDQCFCRMIEQLRGSVRGNRWFDVFEARKRGQWRI